ELHSPARCGHRRQASGSGTASARAPARRVPTLHGWMAGVGIDFHAGNEAAGEPELLGDRVVVDLVFRGVREVEGLDAIARRRGCAHEDPYYTADHERSMRFARAHPAAFRIGFFVGVVGAPQRRHRRCPRLPEDSAWSRRDSCQRKGDKRLRRRTFLLTSAAAVSEAALAPFAWAVPKPYSWETMPPTTSGDAFVKWMVA